MFLGAEAVLLDVGFEVEVDVGDVDTDADDAADDNADEDDAELADVEAVDADVDYGEGLEEGVVDTWLAPKSLELGKVKGWARAGEKKNSP